MHDALSYLCSFFILGNRALQIIYGLCVLVARNVDERSFVTQKNGRAPARQAVRDLAPLPFLIFHTKPQRNSLSTLPLPPSHPPLLVGEFWSAMVDDVMV